MPLGGGVADGSQQISDSIHDSPARFGYSRDLAFQSEVPEADPAEAEVAVKAPRAAAERAAVPEPRRELLRFFHLGHPCDRCH